MPTASPSTELSQTIFTELSADLNVAFPTAPDTSGADFSVPASAGNDLYGPFSKLELDDLTTGVVDGPGAFDTLMVAIKAHLTQEHGAGRITGDQYTKAYIEMSGRAVEIGLQFLLARDQSYWQNLLTQTQAQRSQVELVTARVQLEIAKASLAQQFAQSEAQIRLSMAQYAAAKLSLSNANQDFILKGIQQELGNKDVQLRTAQITGTDYQNTDILPTQKKLLQEQVESQRAQTLDTRSDTAPVAGSVGKQKDLYTEQIASYRKEAQYKIGKMLSDAWITRKTLDENAPIPTSLVDTELNSVMTTLRTTNNM